MSEDDIISVLAIVISLTAIALSLYANRRNKK